MDQAFEDGRGWRFVQGLSRNEEDRVKDFREAVTLSAASAWHRDAIVQAYQLAGSGIWAINSIYDVQMILTAVEENPALMTIIERDVERLLERLERLGGSFRPAWNSVREKVMRNVAATLHEK